MNLVISIVGKHSVFSISIHFVILTTYPKFAHYSTTKCHQVEETVSKPLYEDLTSQGVEYNPANI